MSTFETLTPKTSAQFEVFGHELIKLMRGLASSPHYASLVSSFLSTTLNSAPSTHKSFEKALLAAIQQKDEEERIERQKAEAKPEGLGKYRGRVTVASDDDEEETGGAAGAVVYTEEELIAIAEEEEQERLKEAERQANAEALRKAAEARRIENERLLAEKRRTIDHAAEQAKLEDMGYTVVMPAWDKKKNKKGR